MSIPAYPQNRGMADPWQGQTPGPAPQYYPNQGWGQPGPYPQVPQQQVPQAAPAPAPDGAGLPPIDMVGMVQGDGAAKAFNPGAGKTAILFDMEPTAAGENLFYLKKVDIYGRPFPLQAFRYTAYDMAAPAGDYITREEFEKALRELAGSRQSDEPKEDD